MRRAWSWLGLVLLACPGPDPDPPPPATPTWQLVQVDLPGALLRVWGTGPKDVYAVGADADGQGPMVLHFDGQRWSRLSTGTTGGLWWVDQVGPDDLRMVGEGGQVLRYRPSTGAFEPRSSGVDVTLFGAWGASSGDVWYVGGRPGQPGVALRDDGSSIRAAGTSSTVPTLFKVHGTAADRLTFVGQQGTILDWNGSRFEDRSLNSPQPLLTVHGVAPDALYAVGGFGTGEILRYDGAAWIDETPPELPGMNGVYATSRDEAYAAGFNGRIFRRQAGVWSELPEALPTYLDLHSVWIDSAGGIWAAGGQLSADPPTDGVLIYYGPPIAHGL